MRRHQIVRITAETQIQMELNLDGEGIYSGHCGIGFFDHMLTLLCKHGKLDLNLKAKGDLEVDNHHLIEDLGIALGICIHEAVGEKRGIRRYGNMRLPMDEVLTSVDLDLGGRGYLVYNVDLARERVGEFECETLREFFYALAINGGMNLHINLHYGINDHHKIESIFKAFARALASAVEVIDESGAIPSTKGVL
ncbi:MAG: imidazoleglycerol-phosphate dehydratase HisB [Tissierellia bacterium]|nr:imidazoleglycerol-phosphate dehydratase HisB [Tissierellia bacterium]